jgi:hypothetical protein
VILRFKSRLAIAFVAFAWTMTCSAQAPADSVPALQPAGTVPSVGQLSDPPSPGSVSGTVVDQSGAVVSGAEVRLLTPAQSPSLEVRSGDNGEFSFSNVLPGPFQLTVTSAGFGKQTFSGTLHAGEVALVPRIVLSVAANVTQLKVGLTREEVAEVAEQQLRVEEKQRVLGVLPNYYVSYIPDAAPLTPQQKFKLAMKTVVDPFTFVMVAGAAGVEQAQNHFIGYGQGTVGYAKRFGAGYADTVSGTFIGGAILPSLLKQDPRYFYKGTGSIRFRFFYAIASALICKGDNRRWQPNYSNVLGNLAAGGISNLYYPPQDRNGAELTFVNAGLGVGSTAVGNLFQEFVIRKLTPAVKKQQLSQPQMDR